MVQNIWGAMDQKSYEESWDARCVGVSHAQKHQIAIL